MVNLQLHPLEVNISTGEPFLRLRAHPHIILTPPRPNDVNCYPPILNNPLVHDWLFGPSVPIPQLPEHAQAWFELIDPPSNAVLDELQAAKNKEHLITVGHSPIRVIREVTDDGKDVFLGDIDMKRCKDAKLLAPEGLDDTQKERYVEDNATRPVGDPDIIWTLGYYIAPSHHGQGIMTDVLKTLLWEWCIPRMGIKRITVTACKGNHGSIRVFQKNGFTLTKTLKNHAPSRGGELRDLHILEWDLNGVQPL